MEIKSFSPIQGKIGVINPQSTSFKGTEYYFSDDSESLYCLITRISGADFLAGNRRYYLMSYSKLNGYDNGVDYDYRLDTNDYIWTPHYNIEVSQIQDTGGEYLFTFDLPENFCAFNVMFDPTDFISQTGFTQYISDDRNGIRYIDESVKGECDNYVKDYFYLRVQDNDIQSGIGWLNIGEFVPGELLPIVIKSGTIITGTTTTTTTTPPPNCDFNGGTADLIEIYNIDGGAPDTIHINFIDGGGPDTQYTTIISGGKP